MRYYPRNYVNTNIHKLIVLSQVRKMYHEQKYAQGNNKLWGLEIRTVLLEWSKEGSFLYTWFRVAFHKEIKFKITLRMDNFFFFNKWEVVERGQERKEEFFENSSHINRCIWPTKTCRSLYSLSCHSFIKCRYWVSLPTLKKWRSWLRLGRSATKNVWEVCIWK